MNEEEKFALKIEFGETQKFNLNINGNML